MINEGKMRLRELGEGLGWGIGRGIVYQHRKEWDRTQEPGEEPVQD